MPRPQDKLRIKQAAENNLKNIDLDIPHDSLVVVTGISGSGKSSLAFDTVYAEGQRRYIETFSPYTRQFLDKVKKPNADSIENIRPAIAISQKTRVTSSRSTVGSLTNINDYLKILWSKLSKATCPKCNLELSSWNETSLSKHIHDLHFAKFIVCAPIKIENLQEVPFISERFQTLGFSRWVNPLTSDLLRLEDHSPELDKESRLLLAIDRFTEETANIERLKNSLIQAFGLTNGVCLILSGDEKLEFKNTFCCSNCGFETSTPRPYIFSYNHPMGACLTCRGFGNVLAPDLKLCIPDPRLSLSQNAIKCWEGKSRGALRSKLSKFCEAEKISMNRPWQSLDKSQQDSILYTSNRHYKGLFPWFSKLEKKIYKMHVRVFLSRFRGQFACPDCRGARLRAAALNFKIAGKTLPDIWGLQISDLLDWFLVQETHLDGLPREIRDIFKATIGRLSFLANMGLSYLTLDRSARSLSGGETQRVNLASALGSELVSTLFVLDEPTAGLHARDTKKLISSIRNLQQKGNSLLVVEHDLDCILAADHIIEIGPEAGESGGKIVYNGTIESWNAESQRFSVPKYSASLKSEVEGKLRLTNINFRNLKDFSVDIPLQHFVCLSGVSGSGKSSLVRVIQSAWEDFRSEISDNQVSGFENLQDVVSVDQSPLIKNPRANVASYTGLWDSIRSALSQTEDAQALKLTRSEFSFNVDGGRCSHCKGAGYIREDMQFLSDVFVQCELCLGQRFKPQILQVRYRGLNVTDFLAMSVERAAEFFKEDSKLLTTIKILNQLGLGHLSLGHSLSQLSGGEAQRLKLVPFLDGTSNGKSLIILDEPTTGLHTKDIQKLILLLQTLVNDGHSILCIEHNLAMISSSSWIIDLGPEAGDQGGKLVFSGTPFDFLKQSKSGSHTAQHLKEFVDLQKQPELKLEVNSSNLNNPLPEYLKINGAREHNLKAVNLNVPLNKVVAFTGVSGSGKSTLAKDIIYAEGQRRYLDCLSPHARQYIKELKRPEIDNITNVQPTIYVSQHTFSPSRMSTVATVSEIYNYLRLLFTKVGTQYCTEHNLAIGAGSPEKIADTIKSLGAKDLRLLSPVIKLKKGQHNGVLERARTIEVTEVRADGVFGSPESFINQLEKNKPHSIDFVVAKFNPTTLPDDILRETIEQGLALGQGTIIVHSNKSDLLFSLDRTCPKCKKGFLKPDPEDLSFNSNRGACKKCSGLGQSDNGQTCEACGGSRLNDVGLSIKLLDKNIYELCCLTASQLQEFITRLNFSNREKQLSKSILQEVSTKLEALVAIGLGNLQLNRSSASLSSGELQRLRLASACSSTLSGIMYILDEPSASLHPLDNQQVISMFQRLKNSGNSVLIVEHDADTIQAAEYVIDMGPGGGSHGGQIVYEGPISNFSNSADSLTAQYLYRSAQADPCVSKSNKTISRTLEPKPVLKVSDASSNNIRNLNLEIPLNSFVVFAGVSGAGKSSLLHNIILSTLEGDKKNSSSWKSSIAKITSSRPIERVLCVDQKPIGKNSRSTPISYLKIFDDIRKIFANTLKAKAEGWNTDFFSYNSGKGRCPNCGGLGQIKLEMNFLPDAWINCEECLGTRFRDDAKSVLFKGLNISDILNLTFEEASQVFSAHRKIHQSTHLVCQLGLGYLKLGQSSTTLSGGESQRIKLVSELARNSETHTLYVLDEPTIGLHKADVAKLINVLKSLVAKGNSVLVIEHDADVLLSCDHVIEIGPGAGNLGGKVIFEGNPSKLLRSGTPWGIYLCRDEQQKRYPNISQGFHPLSSNS